MKLHFFGKKSMSLKRFYRYVLITILLVILCFVLTAALPHLYLSKKQNSDAYAFCTGQHRRRISGYRKKLLDALYADI